MQDGTVNSIKAPFVCITCMEGGWNFHKEEQWWERTIMWWQEGLLTRLHADVAQDWIANNWDTWNVQIETCASCYSVMRTVSHYVTMYSLFDRFHGAGLGGAQCLEHRHCWTTDWWPCQAFFGTPCRIHYLERYVIQCFNVLNLLQFSTAHFTSIQSLLLHLPGMRLNEKVVGLIPFWPLCLALHTLPLFTHLDGFTISAIPHQFQGDKRKL